MRVKLIFSYNGAFFSGFQLQNDKRTVQGVLQDALFRLYGEEIKITGSGRTDAGVHALGQVAHFDTDKQIDSNRIAGALNFFLPPEIRILKAEYVDDGFNARKSALSKTYFYDMYFSDTENPFLYQKACRIDKETNIEKMRAAMKLFEGEHDFKEFHCIGSSAKTTIRTVYSCSLENIELYGEKALRFTISANGFLYKMVRLIAGALIKTGQGILMENDIRQFLNLEKPYSKKFPAEPGGLYLKEVKYC